MRERGEPFGALLAAAVDEPGAAHGLALAYAALRPGERRELVDAICGDAAIEGVDAPAVLASLLCVEEDPGIARHIAQAMHGRDGAGLRTDATPRAWVAGDAVQGGALFARPLHGRFAEVLGLAWQEHGVTQASFDPMVRIEDAIDCRRSLPPSLVLEEAPMHYAVDLVTPVLWRHRREQGPLPDCVQRFAELFSPRLDGPTHSPNL